MIVKEIIFPMNDGRVILLTNVVETFGHDDSLPFNATLMLDQKGTGHFTKLARVWNDGWGGLTNIDAIGKKEREICDELDKFISKTYEFRYCYNEQPKAMCERLESMINNMACLAIDNNVYQLTNKILKQLNIYEKPKELKVGDIVDNPREIIKAPGVWNEIKRSTDKTVAYRVVTERKDIIDGTTGEDVTIDICSLKKSLVKEYKWQLAYKF